jgi:predicted permease
VARLKPDVTPAQASAHLEPLVKQAMAGIRSADYRAFLIDGRYRPLVHLMRDDVVGSAVEPLWILLGTVGIVLLIACGNVANLTLIRTDARQREIGVRLALGGSRATLIQSLLVEALVLAVAGASLGVLVAFIALPGLVSLAPATIPRLDEVRIDGVVLAAVAGVTLMAAIIVGLVPALRYTRPSVLGAIRQGGRGVTDHSTRQRGRSVLVAIQTALAMILLVGSGLLARSFMRMMDVDTGFEGRDLMTARVSLPAPSYPERADVTRVVRQIVERLAQLPGATGAAATSDPPIVGSVSGTAMDVEGRTVEPGRMPPIIQYQLVTPGYFAALRTSLQRGRDIDWHDTSGIVVNEVAAAELWPGQDPIGHRLRRSRGAEESPAPWFTVVGVVENIRQEGLRRPAPAQIYFPVHGAFNEVPRAMTCVIQGPATIVNADAVLRAVRAVDGNLPLASIQAMQDIVSDSVVEFSFTMLALGIAAAVALLLGAIGLYGVLAYAVSLQTRDIGLRLALGASPRQIMGSIVRRGVFISSIGLAAGSAGALALTRLLEGLLFETKPLDLPTFVATGTALLAVALAASYVPARRAATISPMESMRL